MWPLVIKNFFTLFFVQQKDIFWFNRAKHSNITILYKCGCVVVGTVHTDSKIDIDLTVLNGIIATVIYLISLLIITCTPEVVQLCSEPEASLPFR